jgi:suppressor of ftsI/bilirubin oxidase
VELPPVRDPEFPNALRLPGTEGMYGVLDAAGAFTMIAKPVRHALVPGRPAPMLAYEVEHQGRTLLNPVLRVRTGTQLRIKFWNALEETSIIHWHGFKVDSNNDGHPHYAVPGGATYDYQYTVANRAGTYWYHPHPHPLTGKQVYFGLAGLSIVEDDEEIALQTALDLRLGETDVPLVLQDRRFDDSGQLVFAPTADERSQGHLGKEVLVNLTPRPHFQAANRIYRFRVLNGSNARMFRLAFRHGEELLDYYVIGTDGGLLDRPYKVSEAFLAPAERMDVLLDLRRAQPGDSLTLVSLPFDPMHREAVRPDAGANAVLARWRGPRSIADPRETADTVRARGAANTVACRSAAGRDSEAPPHHARPVERSLAHQRPDLRHDGDTDRSETRRGRSVGDPQRGP